MENTDFVPKAYKLDIDKRLKFLNDNLSRYYLSNPDHLSGTGTFLDSNGNKYITYALCGYDELIYDGLESIIKICDEIINGLKLAESFHKKEGCCVGKRRVIAEFRQVPIVSIDFDDPNFTSIRKYTISFRMSVYQKEVIKNAAYSC